MNKSELRNKYKLIRKNIINKELKDNIIYNKFINDKDILNAKTILFYSSLKDEVDTFNLIDYFIKSKRIALPKVEGNNIEFYYINNLNELEIGKFNIMEPTTTEKVTNYNNAICVVPGICFDQNNYRVGYGKGYYDRFLCDKDIYTIGLTYKELIVDKIDYDKYDVKLRKVISG